MIIGDSGGGSAVVTARAGFPLAQNLFFSSHKRNLLRMLDFSALLHDPATFSISRPRTGCT
jgi:hypothetical protein